MIGTLIKALFLAAALAVWQLFLQPLWDGWIQGMGRAVGFGETLLGYFMVILTAWFLAELVVRRMKKE